jgi:predicted DNA-binding antitoxin AbrB/MazE fold protein
MRFDLPSGHQHMHNGNKKGDTMTQTITAIYENGVFTPRTRIALPEHTKVKMLISTIPSRSKKSGSVEALFDIATGGTETDVSVNHDKYLYGEAPL